MDNKVVRLYKPPKATLTDPLAQIRWVFFQMEREYVEPTASGIRHARNKYVQYLAETNAYYSELELNPRFYLSQYWEADALIRFNRWLICQELTSKTQYSIYKHVRRTMDFAYALRIIDNIVYHAPMFTGVPETKERAAYAKREQEVINASIARWLNLAYSVAKGYEPTGEGIPYRRKLCFRHIEVDGTEYPIGEASKKFGLAISVITQRLKVGYTARQAVGLDPIGQSGGVGIEVTIEGPSFRSITKAAEAYGVQPRLVAHRLKKGYTPEQAVDLVPIEAKRSDERALLWSFENDYECDPCAMLEDFRKRGLGILANEPRLRRLFLKWGVWPYVDDRLIMPLFVELAMLTGLNVEALKALEIDSFQLEHRLTGQPVISYRKSRSGSSLRSEDRELHLAILELEEFYPAEQVVPRVQALIGLTLKLTSTIREYAGVDVARKLFIFEDIELTRKTGERQIVCVNPKGKAATWYKRFAREEGFRNIIGPQFNFNVARCRPTLATNMVLAGADLFQVQVALGHESIQTTATYLDQWQLKPAFNKTVSEALTNIARRSKERVTEIARIDPASSGCQTDQSIPSGFIETLSGCGCKNPYNPSADVKKATGFKEGGLCKYWNMCLLCDNAIVTENSLPKLIVYRQRVGAALESDSPSVRSRRDLYADVVKLIDGILQPDVIFPKEVLQNAKALSVSLDDLLVDQLIYQGL